MKTFLVILNIGEGAENILGRRRVKCEPLARSEAYTLPTVEIGGKKFLYGEVSDLKRIDGKGKESWTSYRPGGVAIDDISIFVDITDESPKGAT